MPRETSNGPGIVCNHNHSGAGGSDACTYTYRTSNMYTPGADEHYAPLVRAGHDDEVVEVADAAVEVGAAAHVNDKENVCCLALGKGVEEPGGAVRCEIKGGRCACVGKHVLLVHNRSSLARTGSRRDPAHHKL